MPEQMMAAKAVSARIAPPSPTRFVWRDGGLNQARGKLTQGWNDFALKEGIFA
jgi:hypothetical protein